jgi:hypothetical protein
MRTFGAGNAPDGNKEFFEVLTDATKGRGVVIVSVTQCTRTPPCCCAAVPPRLLLCAAVSIIAITTSVCPRGGVLVAFCRGVCRRPVCHWGSA